MKKKKNKKKEEEKKDDKYLLLLLALLGITWIYKKKKTKTTEKTKEKDFSAKPKSDKKLAETPTKEANSLKPQPRPKPQPQPKPKPKPRPKPRPQPKPQPKPRPKPVVRRCKMHRGNLIRIEHLIRTGKIKEKEAGFLLLVIERWKWRKNMAEEINKIINSKR